jgi:hypothetical protein
MKEIEAKGGCDAAAIPVVLALASTYIRKRVIDRTTYNAPSQKIPAIVTLRRVGICNCLMAGRGKHGTIKSNTMLMPAIASVKAAYLYRSLGASGFHTDDTGFPANICTYTWSHG